MPQSPSSRPSPSLEWHSLPTRPGIYIFKDEKNNILYVGKAKVLRTRVSSYFAPPIRLGPKTAKLVSQIAKIDHIEVISELEALLLESKLIKKFQPPFNLAAKDGKSPYYIHLTKEAFPKPVITHQPQNSQAGPFLNSLTARRILKQFRRIAPYCTSARPVTRPCFYAHLGLCSPCPATKEKTNYSKNISRLRRLLSGNFASVLVQLKKEMANYSQNQHYEAAQQVKLQIEALTYLLTRPISPEEYLVNPNLVLDRRQEAVQSLHAVLVSVYPQLRDLKRIEMYDVANLSGKQATAAMTVSIDGEVNSGAYRHFTLKSKDTPDDVSMLKEVLHRRLKNTDWPTPDLIVLDGGLSQLSIVDWDIPTISLAKREELIYTPLGRQIKLPSNHPGLLLLEHLRNEAHRFSRRLHHKHRATII